MKFLETDVGSERLRLLARMRRANLVASILYGLVSLLLCSTYTLPQPHYVGHIFPAAASVITLLWGVHCWFLGVASQEEAMSGAKKQSLLPISVALLAMVACAIRYWWQA